MARLALTMACGDYDRVQALRTGRVTPEGIDLNLLPLEPEECFWRMLRFGEFDIAEMSLSSYCIARAKGDDRFVAIPAFLSRSFRHSSIYLRSGAGIGDPRDLAGRRIGVPEYQMTASVWTRGLLHDDYGVEASSVTWRTGGLEQPGRAERQPLTLPSHLRVEPVAADRTLIDELLDGEIDAIMAPRIPSAFRRGEPAIGRLFPDYAARELDYFQRTGIFPIMHLVVIRADVHARHPWVAQSVYKALTEAKRLALDGITAAPALRHTMPFLLDALERQEAVFGPDPWPYGVAANRPALETFTRYLVEQGLTTEKPDIDHLFAPSTLAESRI
ncbi:ABC transporter substrate-binding protein [Streptosporangium sp. NPDC051022]|uniref:ABC transporter substrate-binding protein n=1 Tax=Streptosporangium sp. NPDC051022 TaxID=3155752 RepID=UPI003442729B